MKIVVCILTSSTFEFLRLCLKSVLNQKNTLLDYDIVINVNTQDELYYNTVIDHFRSYQYSRNIKIIRTQSNGKPGMGHNSNLEYFRTTSYDYMIIIDGDDFFYPYAFFRIEPLLNKNPVAINLYGHDELQINSSGINLVRDVAMPKISYNFGLQIMRPVSNQPFGAIYSNVIMPHKNVYEIGLGFSGIGTPTRILCAGRGIFELMDKYGRLYDDDMFLFDDMKAFLIMYENHITDKNIMFIYDDHIYLYNKCNANSASYSKNDHYDLELFWKRHYDEILPKTKEWRLNDIKFTLSQSPYFQINDNAEYKYEMLEWLIKNGIINNIYSTQQSNSLQEIVFIDYNPQYTFDDLEKRPIGGTETAILFLMKELAKNNKYSVTLITNTGVEKMDKYQIKYRSLENILDYLTKIKPTHIIQQGAISNCRLLKNICPYAKIYIWNQHDYNVGFIQQQYSNIDDLSAVDKFIFVSRWQSQRYSMISHEKKIVIQNAISSKLLNGDYDYNIHKKKHTMVYISAPYRGLTIIKEIFLKVQEVIPDAKLKIFSSMSRDCKSYLVNRDTNEIQPLQKLTPEIIHPQDLPYIDIYNDLISTAGIEFYGSVPQSILFENCREAMVHLYPCIFPETCCTSLLEMMYMGCNIVATNLGALSETSGGLADLLNLSFDVENNRKTVADWIINPITPSEVGSEWCQKIANKVIYRMLNYASIDNQGLIHSGIDFVRDGKTWEQKVKVFEKLLAI